MTLKNTIRIILTILILIAMPASFAGADAKHGITIDDLSAIRDIKTVTVSPDGNYVAFQTIQAHKDTNDFTTDWYVATTKLNAKPIRIGKGTEPVRDDIGQHLGGDIIWSPDSQWIYFIKKHNGAIQIWRSSRKQPDQQQVTHNAGDIQTLQMSPDGSKVFFTIGRTRAEIKALKTSLSKQGFLQQEPPLYYLESGIVLPACTDGQKRFTRLNQTHSCRLIDWVYDIKLGIERKATKVERDSLHDQQESTTVTIRQGPLLDQTTQMEKMSPDGTQVAWIENTDPETYKGYSPPMTLSVSQDGKEITCPAKECISQKRVGFKGVWWHPNGKEIIFHVVDGPHNSFNSFYGWTPGEASVRSILRTDDLFRNCDLTGKRLICTRSTWTSPKEIASIDVESGKISTIVDVNPEFKDLEFTKVEKILGESDHGHKVYAHLVYPKGYKEGQQYPLVITNYHSYGFLRGATGDEQPIHVYAQNGMFVLSFDHRQNNAEYAKKSSLENVNRAFYHEVFNKQREVTAIENMVEALVGRGIIDPKRVGISGLSHGSVILTNALLRKNYAAASMSEIFSIPTYARHSSSSVFGKILDDTFGKVSTAKGQKMRSKYSLAANAQRINTPFLAQVADRELQYGKVVYNALADAEKPVEMYVYPDERHVKWQPAHRYMMYSRNLDWFNFWLQGVEDPDPAKEEQYIRWGKLREMHEANLEKLEEKN